MNKLKVLIFSPIIALAVAAIAFAWTNPTANPPGGGGALYYSDGNVGIGTTGPGATLSVHGTRSSTVSTTTAVSKIGGGDVFLYTNAMNSDPWSVWMQVFNDAGSSLPLVLNPSGGNVGIGTTDPGTNKLEVVGGPIKATGGLIIETRTDDPASPVAGQIWLRTDL